MMNPFKPTAGKMPPILIGRQPLIDDFTEGLDDGAGAPGRIMLVTGQRGYGKTVVLTEFRRIAQARHWATVSETASPGLTARLVDTLAGRGTATRNGLSIDEATLDPHIGPVSLGSVHASASTSPLLLRDALKSRLDHVGKGRGVLITVDESQGIDPDELTALATAVQHVTTSIDEEHAPDSAKKGVALVFAGLPSMMDELVNGRVTTFLRRALHRTLDDVPLPDIRDAFIRSVEDAGMDIDFDTALTAAKATEGYPYMVQLVGYYMVRAASHRGSTTIEGRDVEQGVSDARLAFDDAVCAPVWDGLNAAQMAFVRSMAAAGALDARLSDITEHAGRSRSWGNKYRLSLIRSGVIKASGHGLVRFAIPHLGEYARRQTL